MAKCDQNGLTIGRSLALLSLRDQQIQVKDLADVNGWSLSEAILQLILFSPPPFYVGSIVSLGYIEPSQD